MHQNIAVAFFAGNRLGANSTICSRRDPFPSFASSRRRCSRWVAQVDEELVHARRELDLVVVGRDGVNHLAFAHIEDADLPVGGQVEDQEPPPPPTFTS